MKDQSEPAKNSQKVSSTALYTMIVVLLIAFGLLFGLFFFKTSQTNSTIDSLNKQVTTLQTKITELETTDANVSESKEIENPEIMDDTNLEDGASDDQIEAESVLKGFFTALNSKDYDQAVKYFGGSYTWLQEANPTISSTNYAELFEKGCTMNGYHCLRVGKVLEVSQKDDEFTFTVQFLTSTGEIYVQGPCCGATEEESPSVSDFEFQVQKKNGEFLVITEPVYSP